MARLFYPILFSVTAALAAALWAREGWPVDWLDMLDAPLAQAQVVEAPPPAAAGPANRAPARYPPTQSPSKRYSKSRYSPTYSDPRAGGQAPPSHPKVAQRPASQRPASRQTASRRTTAPPATARLRISLPGANAKKDGPIELETTKLIAQVGSSEHILLGDVIGKVNEEFASRSRHVPPDQHELLLGVLVQQQVQQLIPFKVLLCEVRRKVPKEELEKTWKQVEFIFDHRIVPMLLKERKLDTTAALDAKLKSESSSLEKLKQTFVEQQLGQQYLSDHTKVDEEVHPDDLLVYYQAHCEEYTFSAKVRWEQLLVKFDSRTEREARQLIADMGNQVRGGVPWEAVAKARSEGPTAEEGGKRDWTNQGSLKFDELDHALFTLPVGSMSPILQDDDGFQIIRVVERTPAGAISFEEKQREIKKLIVEERIKKAKNEFVRKIVKEYKPLIRTIFDEPEEAQEERETARRQGATRVQ